MWPISWLRQFRRADCLRRPTARPLLELLEDRTVPSFASAVNYAVGQSPVAIVSADFNNDGVPDLAIANYQSGTVSVLLGNSNGTFQTAKTYAVGVAANSLAVGNFDGKLDIVTANLADG